MSFNREIFFDSVRSSLFNGAMTQSQVDGMNAVLDAWDDEPPSDDLRWLAYCLATDYHETAQEMQPIEEYGKGAGMAYGVPDPGTGQTYYGRGYVQLTWKDNYRKATDELASEGENDLVWYPENALHPYIAAEIMFRGMAEGWFRSGNTLAKFFSETIDDPYGAREIINGDKHIVPSWSNGVSIGNLIKGYYEDFLLALEKSYTEGEIIPARDEAVVRVHVRIDAPPGVKVEVIVDDGSSPSETSRTQPVTPRSRRAPRWI